ncbi:MAG: YbaL family putative K(+) efflux transporter [Thermoanaerobaculia bacterium]
MHAETALVATIAAGLGLAFVFGFLAARLRLPPLVGYLLAGVAVGPFTPGFVADAGLASQLAEIGVILLMFGVGLHFSPKDLMAVRGIAIPGALAQIAAATVLGAVVARFWGWSWVSGLVFGLSLSVASTVVLLRALEDQGLLDSPPGRIAVGWLIVEDLITVIVLVLMPALAGPAASGDAAAASGSGVLAAIGWTLAKVVVFLALMLIVGRRAVPWLLERVARTGSRELFTLAVLATALGIAVGASALFGVSFALGAFFAGVVIAESDLSTRAAADALPLQDAFAVLFFVAVGMLFDPSILLRQPLAVLAVIAIILVGKTLAAFFIVLAFGRPISTALTISASLAQIGEFSFILAALGVSLGLLPKEAQGLIVAGALISITLNPVIFRSIAPVERWLRGRTRLERFERHGTHLTAAVERAEAEKPSDHAVLVGHGRVGGRVARSLDRLSIPYVVVEQERETAVALRARGVRVIYGDAARAGILEHAALERARLLVVAAPDPFQTRAILEHARRIRPDIDTVVRTHTDAEREYLERHDVGKAVMGESELARAMARYALERFGLDLEAREAAVRDEA